MITYRENDFLNKEKEKLKETRKTEQNLSKNIFAFQLNNCPSSLKLIVQVYRIFGFSFSGVTFANHPQLTEHNDAKFRTAKIPSDKSKLPPPNSSSTLGLFFIALNILHIIKEVAFLPTYKAMHSNQLTVNLHPDRSPSEAFNITVPTSLENYDTLHEMKPILRFVMRSMLYVYLVNAVSIYSHNLLLGGRLVRLLATIPRANSSQQFKWEQDRSLGLTIFRYLFLILLLVNAFSLSVYNGRRIWAIIAWQLGLSSVRPTKEQCQVMASLAIVTAIHLSLHIVACFTSALFAYIMATFKWHILELKKSLQCKQQEATVIDEVALIKLKTQIEQLSAHFQCVISNQALPLTLSIVSDIWTMVGTFCFLMVNQDRSEQHQMTFVFNFAVLTFTRLWVICSAGNAATNAYSSFLRSLFEKMSSGGGGGSLWTLDQWLYFREIKLLKGQFKVVIGAGTYCIKQSALLSVLAFSLNYCVVLLQTQEFNSSSSKKSS